MREKKVGLQPLTGELFRLTFIIQLTYFLLRKKTFNLGYIAKHSITFKFLKNTFEGKLMKLVQSCFTTTGEVFG